MPGPKSVTADVEDAVSEMLSPIASNLQDGLWQLQRLEESLEGMLDDVRQRRALLEKAVSAFGTP